MNEHADTCIADYFYKNYPVKQLRRQMYSKENIYTQLPELIVRFSDSATEKAYYDLACCVDSFEGRLEWKLYRCFDGKTRRNYSLVPKEAYFLNKRMYETKQLQNAKDYFPADQFKELCEKGIVDIPDLYVHIQKNFHWQNSYERI